MVVWNLLVFYWPTLYIYIIVWHAYRRLLSRVRCNMVTMCGAYMWVEVTCPGENNLGCAHCIKFLPAIISRYMSFICRKNSIDPADKCLLKGNKFYRHTKRRSLWHFFNHCKKFLGRLRDVAGGMRENRTNINVSNIESWKLELNCCSILYDEKAIFLFIAPCPSGLE